AVYDLYCTNERGEKIIIEIQRVKQEFFKDRSVYYSAFAIQDQAIKGKDWRYEMAAVYTIAIMDFTFDASEKYEHRVKLMDEQTHVVFYEKLSYLYLEVPKFNKELGELESDHDRWLYAFKNLHRLKEKPKELEQGVFKKLFELAEIAKMDDRERSVYEDSLKDYRDLKSAIHTYLKEGLEQGRAQGLVEGREKGRVEGRVEGLEQGREEARNKIALQFIALGLDDDTIADGTGLTPEQVKRLRKA
ncbi:MAG: Rpn family recombination-promoting nuclease/putative transposase, partial [Catalinimonas sp.]